MRQVRGFTLIELMIVVGIVALLAALALSSYSKQVRKSRRAEARQAISQLALAQEKYRASNATYGTIAQIGSTPTSTYYTVTLTAGSNTATGYTFTAVPVGDQAKDPCGTLSFAMLNGSADKQPTTAGCW